MSNAQRIKIRNKISARQARLKVRIQTIHLNKIIEHKDEKIAQLADILKDKVGMADSKMKKLADYLEENWSEYESDNSVGHWNLDETKQRQKKAAERRKQLAKVQINKAKTPHERLSMILKDRLISKQNQIEKYQQNDEKDDAE